jgi:hypothetical protein
MHEIQLIEKSFTDNWLDDFNFCHLLHLDFEIDTIALSRLFALVLSHTISFASLWFLVQLNENGLTVSQTNLHS